ERRKVSIFGSARTDESNAEYVTTRDFAEQMARRGWMVITGAGPGIMAAGHEGAGAANSFGVGIKLPVEQGANGFIAGDPKLVDGGLVSPEDLSLYELAGSIDDAIGIIERFYSNYHSARYVGERLVIRLRRKPRQEQLERLSREFRDVLARGKIHAIGATPEEVRDADAAGFPRIALYATYNFGRIRQLIDALNALE